MGLLRLLLAFSVVSAHAGPILGSTLVGGKIAVQSFFLISGFYMALILQEKYVSRKKSYHLFMTNRLLRIFPAYWCILFLTFIISLILVYLGEDNKFTIYFENKSVFNFLPFLYLLFSQLFIICLDWVMFMGIDVTSGNLFLTHDYLSTHPLLHNFILVPQAWTISLELLFYCLAPFLVKRKLWVLILLIILSLLLRFYLYSIGLHREPWTNRFFPTEFVFFLFGILSYQLYTYIRSKNIPFLSLGCFITLVITTILYNFFASDTKSTVNTTQLAYFGLLFVSIPFVFQLTKANSFDRLLGILSFPVYLSHALVIDVLQRIIPISNLFGVETVLITLCVSVVIVYIVEKPVDRYRQHRVRITTIKKSHNKNHSSSKLLGN